MSPLMMSLRRHRFALASGVVLSVLAPPFSGCGVRTDLDEGVLVSEVEPRRDAGTDESLSNADEADPSDASTGRESLSRPIDVFSFLPGSGATPAGACVSCVESNCGAAINNCVNDRNCVEGIACVVMQCSVNTQTDPAKAMSDFACLASCFNGDLMTALQVTSGAVCVTQTCATACSSLAPSGDSRASQGDATPSSDIGSGGAGISNSGSAGSPNVGSKGSFGGMSLGGAGTAGAGPIA